MFYMLKISGNATAANGNHKALSSFHQKNYIKQTLLKAIEQLRLSLNGMYVPTLA